MSLRKKLSELNRRRKERRRANSAPAVPVFPITPGERIPDCREVGMRDANLSGWFNQHTAEVLEHVDCPKTFLSELVRIGKPGALYLLAVPDPVAEEIQTHVAPAASFQKPNHIRIIGREEFGQLVTEAGLTIVKRDSYGAFWGIFNTFLWSCHTSFDKPDHPILNHWTQAWHEVLNLPDGQKLQRLLNNVIPKSQVIIAMKPR